MSAAAPHLTDADLQAVLTGLVGDGAKISADLAAEDGPAGPKAEPYERITRAVRRTIILVRHIAEHPTAVAEDPAQAIKTKLALARRRIASEIGEDVDYAEREGRNIDSLRDELRERLDDPELDLDILHGSVEAIIATIRRDLDLANSRYSKPLPRRPTPPPDPPLDETIDPDEIEPDREEDFEDEEEEEDEGEELHPLIAALRKPRPVRDG